MGQYKVVRNFEFGKLFELFFVSSIVTIIFIRLSLQITGFPQLATGDLHIAHMLWGGICMMISLLGFMFFLNDDFKYPLSVLGGIGFGTFIDELGKFITRDNNYFYQPTFAVLYVLFILLYLAFRSVERRSTYTKDEYLINAVEELKEVVIKDLDREERTKMLHYLSQSHSHNEIALFMRQLLSGIHDVPSARQSYYAKTKHYFTRGYRYFLQQSWFLNAVVVFFLARSIWYLLTGTLAIAEVINNVLAQTFIEYITPMSIRQGLQVIALFVQAIYTIFGAWYIRSSRRQAYMYFKVSVLVSVFVLQIFNFYHDPATALLMTVGDLLLISVLNYMIKKEESIA